MTQNGEPMPRVFFYSPHPDDETLSMGLAILYYLCSGYEVHLVSMTNGEAIGVCNTLNGEADGVPVPCNISGDHPYTHSPAREGYEPLTVQGVGDARILEARSALGMMAMIPGATGTVVHHVAGLPAEFGHPGAGSSTAPVTPEGIAAAKTVIKQYVDEYPNSFHHTMSESDDHHDHAACGYALRELKNDAVNKVPWADRTYRDALAGSRFFVSRLYWATTPPQTGEYPPDLVAAAAIEAVPPKTTTLGWFPYGPRYADFCDWMLKVIKVYRAWNPAAGTYGIGFHQVAAQFLRCFPPATSTDKQGNLWHS